MPTCVTEQDRVTAEGRGPIPVPKPHICHLMWQRGLTGVITSRVLRRGDYSGVSGWARDRGKKSLSQ